MTNKLTDERISQLWSQAYNDALSAAGIVLGNADVAHITRPLYFARAIEREIAAPSNSPEIEGIEVLEKLEQLVEDISLAKEAVRADVAFDSLCDWLTEENLRVLIMLARKGVKP